jgi:alpha-methylacyl-CoA racemase
MQRILLDLKALDGREVFLTLADKADVIVESFRPGVVDRLGVGYEAVRATNPRIVYCSTSGYGQKGPRSTWAGHDINYLAVGGFLASSSPRADGGPPIPGATVADAAAGGMHAALAILAAVIGQRATGEGAYLDVSVADGVLWLMSLAIDEHLATGSEPGPGHDILTGRYACYDTYQASDGRWLALGAIEPKFYANLCQALGCPQWIESQHDDASQDAIRRDFTSAFATRTRDEWVEVLAGADTCVSPVLAVSELGDDPQLAARHAIVEAEHPDGVFRQLGPVLAGMPHPQGPVPIRNTEVTDVDELLGAAGFDAERIAALKQRRVVA